MLLSQSPSIFLLGLAVVVAAVANVAAHGEGHDMDPSAEDMMQPEVTIIDLSEDLQPASSGGSMLQVSPGAAAVEAAAKSDPQIRVALVLEKGEIVSEWVRDDVDPAVPFQMWSTTKSWISLLLGLLIQDDLLSLNTTLGEIWPNASTWENITDDAAFRQDVTIEELLTMSSGLVSPPGELDVNTTVDLMDGGNGGGVGVEGSLAYPEIGPKSFSYLGISNIPSYIIQQVSGMSPREYLKEKVLPLLGIADDDIGWWKDSEGVEYSYHGIELTPQQMAKFGQLYLQGGLAAPGKPLINSEWVSASTEIHAETNPYQEVFMDMFNLTEPFFPPAYGYLFWITDDGVYCAVGAGAQEICVHAELQRVSVQQRDLADMTDMGGYGTIANAALNPSVSFSTTTDDASTRANEQTTSASSSWTVAQGSLVAFGLLSFVGSIIVA